MKMKRKALGVVAVLSAVLMWASSFPLLKFGILHVPPVTLAAIRYIIAALFMFVLAIVMRGFDHVMNSFLLSWKRLAVIGLVGFTLPNAALNLGLELTTAATSSVIQASGPAFTILLAVVILHERLTIRKWISMVIALIGTILLVLSQGGNVNDDLVAGNILVLLSAVSYSLSGVISKRELAVNEPIIITCWGLITGSLMLCFAIPLEVHEPISISLDVAVLILYLGIFPGCLAFLFYYYILKDEELSSVSYFLYLIPLFSTLMAIPLLHESITLEMIFFGAVIVTGVAIAQYNPPGNRSVRNGNRKD